MGLKEKQKIEFSWSAAETFAAEFVDRQFRIFICDNMTKEFYETHEKPREPKGWGGIITNLKMAGKIKPHGVRLYKPNEGGPMRYGTEWISKVYSEKQSAASKKEPVPNPQINITFDGDS